jgi:uncharacterized protein YndB with AHSA1/START domain
VSGSGSLLWQGKVLRSEPPRLLSFSFDVTGSGETPTRVTFELDRPVSKIAPYLTVTQAGFEENSKMRADCARAWTEILSSIKSYVETGKPLPFAWKH